MFSHRTEKKKETIFKVEQIELFKDDSLVLSAGEAATVLARSSPVTRRTLVKTVWK